MNNCRWYNLLVYVAILGLCFSSQPVQAQPVTQEPQPPEIEGAIGESNAPVTPGWSTDFRHGIGHLDGTQAYVFALAIDDPNLYIGGRFDYSGSIDASNITRWDGTNFYAMGEGVNGEVLAITTTPDFVIVGGWTLLGSNHPLARWNKNTQEWSALGEFGNDTISPEINAIVVADNGDIYVGGDFESVDGIIAKNIAYYNSSTGWHALGAGLVCTPEPCNDMTYALLFDGSTLYAGGIFNRAGGIAVSNLAKWNGSTWSNVTGGVGGTNSTVNALVMSGSTLYVGGQFDFVNATGVDIPASNVASLNGTTWNTMSGGVNIDATSMVVRADGIYVGGRFSTAGSLPAENVARWDGANWSVLQNSTEDENGVNSNVYALAADADSVYIGGFFTLAGENTVQNIAGFTSGKWHGLGDSVSGIVRTLYTSNADYYELTDYVYIGGSFKSAGDITQYRISRWNTKSKNFYYVTTGSSITGCRGLLCSPSIRAIYADANYLYVGGNFTAIGGTPADGIARFDWNTWTWSEVGGGVNSSELSTITRVNAIIPVGNQIYIGGRFDKAGDTTVNNVARWNGSSWSALQDFSYTGTNSTVNALALLSNGNLAVGGNFTTPEPYIAGWNGSNWYSLGNDLNGAVFTIAGDNSAGMPLYVGGNFTSPAHIARLSSGSWVGLDNGLNDAVLDLELDPAGNLYAGGSFTTSGVIGVNHIAMWNKNDWTNLGEGMDGDVNTLEYYNGWLYAGGNFLHAGGQPSYFLARWGVDHKIFLPIIQR